MVTRSLVGLMGFLAVGGGLVAQEPQPQQKVEGTRDLYYFGATQKDKLPPIRKVSTAARPKSTAAATLSAGTETDRAPTTPGAAEDAAGVAHLGFRYTVALVNQTTGKAEAVLKLEALAAKHGTP